MGIMETLEAFTTQEMDDIIAAAKERGKSVLEVIHDAVMDNLVY